VRMVDRENLMDVARDVENTIVDPSDILLTDQVAVVTGGGGGIGQGIALGMARFGCDVAILDIVPERCEATQAAVERLGRKAIGIPVDVMDTPGLTAAIERAHGELGGIDILVNNVGGIRPGPFVSQPQSSVRRHVEINLLQVIFASQTAAQFMIDAGRGGSIVNVASIEGMRAAPMFAVYAACKAGMLSFTKTMAVELAEHGIRVNAITPDHTVTPGARGNRSGPVDESSWIDVPAEMQDAMDRLVPLGREGHVDECGDAVLFLCSAMASYVTGVVLPVDGGTSGSGGWVRARNGKWTLNEGLDFI
jgi:NAD(P)-dependent dehydrogenase (short-subunit alcohol dehydrogenase family)